MPRLRVAAKFLKIVMTMMMKFQVPRPSVTTMIKYLNRDIDNKISRSNVTCMIQ